ncbi:hypothetical protein VQ042_11865 [Aurantimonas sp. A2-1-M11]|uniref:hypothetical protein n=1 Tax=Aurantimonas sp. A2-1-M11 TaxID=3113712 RepID=UPI002F95EBF4
MPSRAVSSAVVPAFFWMPVRALSKSAVVLTSSLNATPEPIAATALFRPSIDIVAARVLTTCRLIMSLRAAARCARSTARDFLSIRSRLRATESNAFRVRSIAESLSRASISLAIDHP